MNLEASKCLHLVGPAHLEHAEREDSCSGAPQLKDVEWGQEAHRTEAPSEPSAGSAAGSQICLGRLLPARYLKLGTFLPMPASTNSPLPPLPDLHIAKDANPFEVDSGPK